MLEIQEMIRLHDGRHELAGEDNLPGEQADDREGREPAPPTVLVVDDDRSVREVLCAVLREEGYVVRQASTAAAALESLRGGGDLPLVLSDVKMPGQDGLWLLGQILQRHPSAAVVMLTGYGDTEGAVKCLRRGAADYLLKPPRVTELVRAIERAHSRRKLLLARSRYHEGLARRVREKTAELSHALDGVAQAYSSTLSALVHALDAREHETSDHSQRVARYTAAIATRMGIDGPELDEIGRGALLHDIGKIGVPDSILLKAGPLTASEWVMMRRHPDIGFRILEAIEFLRKPAQIVLSHQERWDGQGYPRKLVGEEIPLGARIFMLADTLDAMTSDRPYRKAATFAAARQEIGRCAGTQFDPHCAEAFLSLPEETLVSLRAMR